MNPFVSIVVPCFNADETLAKTLDSVLSQDYPDYEVILVDDGSTDSTPEIIHHYVNKDKRFKSFRQENMGVSAARNNGVKNSNSEFISFLDADDLFYGNSITDRIKAMVAEDSPDLIGVFCPAEMVFKDGTSMGLPLISNHPSLPNERVYFSYMPESLFNPSCVILKKRKFLEVGGFDETIAPAEDFLMWHEMMRRGGFFRIVRSCKIGYTQHPASAVRSRLLRHFNQCKRVYGKVFSNDPGSIQECIEGFGQSLYHISISSRAFNTSVMAIATGQIDIAKEISGDISKYALEVTPPATLEAQIKFSVLRALCRHQKDWQSSVWPAVRKDILDFITGLNERLGGDCCTLIGIKERLEKIGQKGKAAAAENVVWGLVSKVGAEAPFGQAMDWFNNNPRHKTAFLSLAGIYTLVVLTIGFISALILF